MYLLSERDLAWEKFWKHLNKPVALISCILLSPGMKGLRLSNIDFFWQYLYERLMEYSTY